MLQTAERAVEPSSGYLLVEGRVSSARALGGIYRELAVACIDRQIASVLVRFGTNDYSCSALRDAFTMMLLAGIPGGFKVAFVTGVQASSHLLEGLRRDLERLRIKCAVFEDEHAAEAWLGSRERVAVVS